MEEQVAITGATGFIGSHVAEYFSSKGVKTVCLARSSSDTSFLKGLNTEIRTGDITEPETLVTAFHGCTAVIHTAARAADWGPYEEFAAVNIQGTLNVLQACIKQGISRCIITGSISVYGEEDSDREKDESCSFQPHYKYFLHSMFPSGMNHYRETKAEAEKKAAEFAEKNGIDLTILEPVWVYGEREFHTGFYEYLKSAKSGMPFMPGSKKNSFHVIYAGDLARAFFIVYKKELSGIHRFIIGNRKSESMEMIFTMLCNEAGIKRPLSIPKWLIYPGAFFLELFYALFRFSRPPLLTRARVNMFFDSIQYSTAKAEKELGFTNEFTLEEGIKRTVAWYKQYNYL
jgi:nucleoside-diphosphate-sugar epimerase